MITTTLISRLQFAFTVSFHILFPTFSIGLALFLTIMEGFWLKTKNKKYLAICKFWSKIFALTFGMGVVSGIVMEFQFGTNWSGFTNVVGGVLGALFTYEVLTAFFIEAGFLGVMLFGWDRVGPRLHFLATLLVCVGTTISAFWIMAANSWMQTPAGFIEEGGKLIVNSWSQVIFNHSTLPRFVHMLLASYISTSFAIAGIAAHYLLKKRFLDFAQKCFTFALSALIVLIPVQIFVGDMVGLKVHEFQPLKTAAMEGIWETQTGAPFLIFAIPSQNQQKNYFSIGIPHVAAFINTHDWNGNLVGLKSVVPNDQPYVPFVFYSFRIMVYLAFLMFLVAALGLWFRYKKNLFEHRWFLQTCKISAPIGFLALWCGWITTETGRQPWTVQNLLRTSDIASQVDTAQVITTFVLLFVVYGIIFGFFYFHYLLKIIRKGPSELTTPPKELAFPYMPPVSNMEKPHDI
jgi:cytochrome d ubiquinol oxidase subunit I